MSVLGEKEHIHLGLIRFPSHHHLVPAVVPSRAGGFPADPALER